MVETKIKIWSEAKVEASTKPLPEYFLNASRLTKDARGSFFYMHCRLERKKENKYIYVCTYTYKYMLTMKSYKHMHIYTHIYTLEYVCNYSTAYRTYSNDEMTKVKRKKKRKEVKLKSQKNVTE